MLRRHPGRSLSLPSTGTDEDARFSNRSSGCIVSAGSPALSAVVPGFLLAYSRFRVTDRTDTLGIGSHAPEFSLGAANREGAFTLAGLLERGPLILEFLRGTW